MWITSLALISAGCPQSEDDVRAVESDSDVDSDVTLSVDNDDDGSPLPDDCDDTNPLVHPDATETCNGADDDCDGQSDQDDTTFPGALTVYEDVDRDSYGDTTTATWRCETTAGFTLVGGDCDDDDPNLRPGAIEVCNDIDDDCDGKTDSEDPSLIGTGHPTAVVHYEDGDGDGYVSLAGRWYCTDPGTPVGTAGTDCDDLDNSTFPGAAQAESGSSCRRDLDDDGYGDASPPAGVTPGNDCNDGSRDISPAADEVFYDAVDDDCDPDNDWDGDGDGHAREDAPGGLGDDCDDTNDDVYTGAIDPPLDSIDQDCDGVDDPCTLGQWAQCPATSCEDARLAGMTTSGFAWVQPVSTAVQTWCEQTLSGGGWTLVAGVGASTNTWTWNNGSYWHTSTSTFGTTFTSGSLAGDRRLRLFWEQPMRQVMFLFAPRGTPGSEWAMYTLTSSAKPLGSAIVAEVGTGTLCYGSGGGIAMTAGSIRNSGDLCSTSLYLSPRDQDGTLGCTCADCLEDTYGPAWSTQANDGCPLDGVGRYGSLGPSASAASTEQTALGFATAIGARTGLSSDTMLILVR